MKIIKRYEVGDEITFTEFAYNNVQGGTGLSDWSYGEKFIGVAKGIVIKCWEDDETGWNSHVRPTSPDLIEYLKRNSKIQVCYVSEFKII